MPLPAGETWESLRDEATRVAVYARWWDGSSWQDQVPETPKAAEVGKKTPNALGLHDMSVMLAEKGRGQTPRYCVRYILPNNILISSSLI